MACLDAGVAVHRQQTGEVVDAALEQQARAFNHLRLPKHVVGYGGRERHQAGGWYPAGHGRAPPPPTPPAPPTTCPAVPPPPGACQKSQKIAGASKKTPT